MELDAKAGKEVEDGAKEGFKLDKEALCPHRLKVCPQKLNQSQSGGELCEIGGTSGME